MVGDALVSFKQILVKLIELLHIPYMCLFVVQDLKKI